MTLSFSTRGSEPVLRKVIQIHLELYADQKGINEACDSDHNVNGCTWNLSRGRWKVIAGAPNDFCDWNAMRTMGHEFMHALGFVHSETYAVDNWDVQPSWTSRDCRMGVGE